MALRFQYFFFLAFIILFLNSMIGIPIGNSFYGNGTGSIWIDNMDCTGNETNIGQCQRKPWGQNDCDHSEDASVICIGEIFNYFYYYLL